MIYIQHRVNTVAQLAGVPREYGVELDLRDRGDRLIMVHDPFGDGEDFETYAREYRGGLMVLNIKSERIEHRVLDVVKRAGIKDYFFLDSSFPMIRLLASQGEKKIAMRFSELEPAEGALAMAGKVEWVWVDCFTKMPFDRRSYEMLRPHFKFCAVSPELQGRSVETIAAYARELGEFPVDAVCTKRVDLWKAAGG